MRIAVLGGGIAGLTAAFHLQQEHDVVVFEASDRLGGNVHTEEIGGCLVEWARKGSWTTSRACWSWSNVSA